MPEDLMGNEGLQRDVKETEMMKHNDLDQGVMIKVSHLLRVRFPLDNKIHPLNTPEQVIRDV